MNPHNNKQRKMGITMFILGWAVLLALLVLFYDDWLGDQFNPNQQPASNTRATVNEVVLQPNRQHHYLVNGKINDQVVTFLLDTGATDVVIPQSLAKRLGLQAGRQSYANTANGTVTVYSTQINTMQIGVIQWQNIRASINPGMKDDVVLLGMSALRQIEFSQRGETLILRQ